MKCQSFYMILIVKAKRYNVNLMNKINHNPSVLGPSSVILNEKKKKKHDQKINLTPK